MVHMRRKVGPIFWSWFHSARKWKNFQQFARFVPPMPTTLSELVQDQARRWSVEQICTCPYAESALMRRPSSKPWPSKFCTPRVKALALMMAWLQSISWSTCVNLIWAAAILKLLTHLPPRIQLSPRMSWIANKNQTRSRRATLSSSIITPGSKQPKMKAWETET